ncbi:MULTISPECIES: TetR/AcrR family transcriptional regulator [unclassified Chelatococcus]|uniref:TetR/AcrR family transcriptional regulator n=1 Tax=unclassified Chelatococcus TaxID=2638111 RepID=UPI001BD0F4B8|nr:MULTISPECIES: TetR/AcrR family transcriptional regulator [unclassified Chelatococcus]MBS7701223.1 TetR family transcriptional regulator [Chelatococcus sp. YT9]MBX3557354.1 TetR family transcriptional regulator [Chelatococcus sp.]
MVTDVKGKSSATRGPSRRRDRDATDGLTKAEISRERVLAAAARIFSERGYAGTTMRAIAKEADLQAGSLYYYYPSKELLIEAVLGMGVHGVSTAVYTAIADLPPSSTYADRIRAAISAHLHSILEFGDYALASRRVLGQVPPEVRRKHVLRRDAYGEFWVKLLEAAHAADELRSDVDLKLARTFMLGALNSALEWYRPNGMPISEVATQFTTLIAEGLFRERSDRA